MEKKSKILIVDDSLDTVELLRKRLRFEGYDTAEAYDGEEALKQVAECNPDLVILDVIMPKLDGYEVCRRLKSQGNTEYIPILMLTGKDQVDDKIKGLNLGADHYLSKPFDYKELSARVRSLVVTKEAREKLVAEEKSKALEYMMGEIEHGMRNPLTSIGGFARRVFDRLSEDDPNKKYMEMIIHDVARLENMIEKLVELKTTAISYKEVSNFNDLIKETLASFLQDFENEGIEVEARLADQPLPVSMDREQMKMALTNLIENSIEAMEEDPKRLKIVSHASNGRIEIELSDTGKGIPKDKIKNIFDPFFSSKIDGPGLGLTLALKIVQEHRGTISVESERGKWSAFTIKLPLKRQ